MKRELTGTVIRKSGAKTVAVEVMRVFRHPKYGKSMKRSTVYLAHDERDATLVGQVVTIRESRPLSARKRWIIWSA